MSRRDDIAALFPPRPATPPLAHIVSVEATTFGTREIVEYDVRPGERVRAILLVPEGRGPRLRPFDAACKEPTAISDKHS